MKRSKKPWSRSEKWLVVTPIVAWLGFVGLRRLISPARELPTRDTITLNNIAVASRNGLLVAAGSDSVARRHATDDGELWLWNADALQPRRLAASVGGGGRGSYIWSIAVSPDGRRIARAKLGDVRVLNARTGALLLAVPPSRNSNIAIVAFAPDDDTLAVLRNKEVQLWSVAARRLKRAFKVGKTAEWSALAFSPDGSTLGLISATALPKMQQRSPWSGTKQQEKMVFDSGAQIRLYNVKTGVLRRTLPDFGANAFAFSPDSRSIYTQVSVKRYFSVSYGHQNLGWRLLCRDAARGALKWKVERASSPRNATSGVDVAVAPNGRRVAVLTHRDEVLLFAAANGRHLQTLSRFPRPNPGEYVTSPRALAFSPDGQRLYARGKNVVRVWNVPR